MSVLQGQIHQPGIGSACNRRHVQAKLTRREQNLIPCTHLLVFIADISHTLPSLNFVKHPNSPDSFRARKLGTII